VFELLRDNKQKHHTNQW